MNSHETLPMPNENNQDVLQAIKAMQSLFAERFDRLESRIGNVEDRLEGVESRLANVENRLANVEKEILLIKDNQFSFDIRLERIQAMCHESLNIGYDLRASTKVLQAELRSWANDVADLQQKAA